MKIKKVSGKKAVMENGIEAYYDKKIGIVKPNDRVLVYGNLIVNKITDKST